MNAIERMRAAEGCADHARGRCSIHGRVPCDAIHHVLDCDPCVQRLVLAVVPETPTVAMIEAEKRNDPRRTSVAEDALRALREEIAQ